MIAMPIGCEDERPTLLTVDRQQRRGIFYLKTDLPLSDSRLRALRSEAAVSLAERTPAIASLPAVNRGSAVVTPLAAGTYHLVHRVTIPGAAPIVIRSTVDNLFDEDRGLLIDGAVRIWLSAYGAGDLVVDTLASGFLCDGAPFDYTAQTFARGRSLRDLGDAILDEDATWLAGIGEALLRVHAVEGDGAGLLDCDRDASMERPRGVHDHWADYIMTQLEWHVGECADAGHYDAAYGTRILKLFDRMKPELERRPMRLLHGDPGTHNVCFDPMTRRLTTILDWEDAMVGDPLFDIALASSFHPARRFPALMQGYGLSPSVTEKRLIALYFLRIALSKTVHRRRFGIVDLPSRMPGHHRIYRGVDELEALL